jgi:hypothetical protein
VLTALVDIINVRLCGAGPRCDRNWAGTQVQALAGLTVESVVAGGAHSLAVVATTGRPVYAWGDNRDGQCGIPCIVAPAELWVPMALPDWPPTAGPGAPPPSTEQVDRGGTIWPRVSLHALKWKLPKTVRAVRRWWPGTTTAASYSHRPASYTRPAPSCY